MISGDAGEQITQYMPHAPLTYCKFGARELDRHRGNVTILEARWSGEPLTAYSTGDRLSADHELYGYEKEREKFKSFNGQGD